jgi:hypothetical protein
MYDDLLCAYKEEEEDISLVYLSICRFVDLLRYDSVYFVFIESFDTYAQL